LVRLPHLLAVLALTLPAAMPALAGPSPAINSNADRTFAAAFGDHFLDTYWPLHRDQAIFEGYYQVADRLNVPDARYRAGQLRFLDSWLARLRSYQPEALDAGNRTDQVLLENELESERWYLTDFKQWQWDPSQYNVAEPLALILSTNYAPLDARLRTVLSRLRDVPAYYAAAEVAVQQPTLEHTQLAIDQNQGALDVLGADLDSQLAGSHLSPAERTLFKKRLAAARQAVSGYIAWLKDLQGRLAQGGARTFRIGAALYERKFAYDIQSGGTAQALYERAAQDKEKLLQDMDKLTAQLWPQYLADTPQPADRFERIGRMIDKLSEQHVARADFVPAVRELIPQLEQWINDHHLIELDPGKPLEVRTTPVYEQGTAIAGIEAPGPYDPRARTYFNVTPLDSYTPERAESFLREYNRWILPVFIIHEAIPGHYVQLIYANRSPSRVRSIFGNGAMIEGWAVYCERMMLESGYGGNTPEQWLMFDKWNLREVTNTLLDYGVHVQGLSEADAEHLLTHEAFQSEAEATAKWRRVQLTSVQLTSYYSGSSEILDLRERQKQALGPAFDLKRFHEKLLSYGSAPVKLIREMMTSGQ
jgi:uncharacterized protein (DUF885 family)